MFALLLIAAAALGGVPPCSPTGAAPGELKVEQMPPEWGVSLPQITICTSDSDCPGCQRCRADLCRDVGAGADTACMCDAECVGIGRKSCDRSPLKALCDGYCSDSAPGRPLPCGRGDDTVRLERFSGRECVAPATVPASNEPIAVDLAAPQPTPLSPTCGAPCARLEAIAPVTELLMPGGDSAEASVVTFAGGRWYAAWGGRGRSNATLVQRFTAGGQADGPAVRVEGTSMPRALAATPHRGGQLILLGFVSPAYTAAGSMLSLHRFDLDLQTAGPPLLLSGPGTMALAYTVEAEDTGGLLWTAVLDRTGILVREVRVPPDATPRQALATRDWWLQANRSGSFERIAGRNDLVDAEQGSLRIRALLDGGALGVPRLISELPAAEGRPLVFSQRVGGRWYVGAQAGTSQRTLRIQALDAPSLAPAGGLIELSWPSGYLEALIDAGGTPMLMGNLQPFGAPGRTSLVPLDVTARAACRANTIALPTKPGRYQMIRAIRFNGGEAGMTISEWGGSAPARLFFTRLRCAGSHP